MATRRVGIDIGATAVRVAETDGINADSIARITRASIVPLFPGAVAQGRIKDINAVGYAIERALKKAGVNGYGVVVGVSSPESAIVPTHLHTELRPSEWSRVLRNQGKAVSPRVPLAQSALSLYEVGVDEHESTRKLLAAATSQEEVDAVAESVRAAKATPRAIDLSGAATARALVRVLPGNEDVVTVVDIGASKTTIVTRQGLFLRSVRTLDIGGENITRAIQGAVNCDFDIAEHRKRGMSLGSDGTATLAAAIVPEYGSVREIRLSDSSGTADPAQAALEVAVSHLIEQISTVIESDTAVFENAPTQGLVLTGGGSHLLGLKEEMSRRIGVSTMKGRPWATLATGKGTATLLEEMDEPTAMTALATAVGLAMWGDQ